MVRVNPQWAERMRDIENTVYDSVGMRHAVDKSGFLIHGSTMIDPISQEPLPKPVHYMVAPWSQGRFSDDRRKLYFLAKGSVDKGEAPYDSGLRESLEETGIDTDAIMAGTIDGVRALRQFSQLCSRKIYGSGGNPWYSHVYAHEVTGIEHLTQYLKNPEAQDQPIVQHGISLSSELVSAESEPTKRDRRLPSFDAMLDWLYEGEIPALARMDGKMTTPIKLDTEHRFRHIERIVMGSAILERVAGRDVQNRAVFSWRDAGDHAHHIKNAREFGLFRDVLGALIKDEAMIGDDKLNADDRKWLDGRIDIIKKALLDAGILGGDKAVVKLDLRERPLQPYQEGADLLPVSEFLTRVVREAYQNKRYARNMMNVHDAPNLPGGMVEAIQTKQLGMMMHIVQPEDIEAAEIPNEVKSAMRQIIAPMLTREAIDNSALPEETKPLYLDLIGNHVLQPRGVPALSR